MRVLCRHGHLAFYETYAGEIAYFMDYYGVELERDGEFFTFPLLRGAPDYSLAGKPYRGILAVKTFAGKPWDILRENGFVYNISTKTLVPKATVLTTFNPVDAGGYYTHEGPLIQPGSWVDGKQILSYDAAYGAKFLEARISEYDEE